MHRDITALAGALVGAGVLHLVRPAPFEKIVPRAMPRKTELVYASGVVEIVTGAMMLHPRTRRLGGLGAAGLLVGVFPANVQMAADAARSSRSPRWYRIGTLLRLPLQAPMIRIAVKAARS